MEIFIQIIIQILLLGKLKYQQIEVMYSTSQNQSIPVPEIERSSPNCKTDP